MLAIEEQVKALSPAEKARALEILKELELTEWQRWFKGALQELNAFTAQCASEGTNISYCDLLKEAKSHRARQLAANPNWKSLSEILAAKPDEVARQARLDRDRDAWKEAAAREHGWTQEKENEASGARPAATPQEQPAMPAREESAAPIKYRRVRDGWIIPGAPEELEPMGVLDRLSQREDRDPMQIGESWGR
ncbi:MAG: hypothetical protein ACHQIK_17175 [Candidatus Acidiferrales bacterium]